MIKLLICKDIQMGSGAKSYMRKVFPKYKEMRKFFTIYEEAVCHIWLCTRSLWISLYMRGNFIFFFISVVLKLSCIVTCGRLTLTGTRGRGTGWWASSPPATWRYYPTSQQSARTLWVAALRYIYIASMIWNKRVKGTQAWEFSIEYFFIVRYGLI